MQYKWAQLDLARQMESVDFIKAFMDTLSKAGYNGIELYLEDRIRTASYPWAEEGSYYTPQQMADIVAYGDKLGMEVVPCVATLGHAERFLAHKELEHLAELQGDMKGRFGGTAKQTFCPSNPQFYPFIQKYLEEVAAIFPSKFFHVGLDEFWDYCLCPACQKAAPTRQAQSDLFVSHIKKIHQILKGAGKRIMMWSDMYEYYPEALEDTPRDVIMVDWQYQQDVRFYLQHLFDCTVENRLALNKKLGFETFLGPVDMLLSNARSYLEYAPADSYTGCLLTSWEKTDTYLYRTMPVFVYAGYLMNGKSDADAFDAMMQQLFGTDDPILAATVRMVNTAGLWRHFASVSNSTLFSRNFYGTEHAAEEQDASAAVILRQRLPLVRTELGRTIITDMLDALNEKNLSHQLSAVYNAVFDGRPLDQERLQKLNADFEQYLDRMAELWNTYRPGIAGNAFLAKKEMLLKRLGDNAEILRNSRFLKLRLCLPDGYGIQHVRVSLRFHDSQEWTVISDNVPKQRGLNTSLYEHFLPYSADKAPVAVKLESYGMGGIGICWVETEGFQPTCIRKATGVVSNPEHLLDNDVKFAWFGTQSTRDAYNTKAIAEQVHSVILE